MNIRCNLKSILNEKDISIRELERMTDKSFESLRRLYNDTTVQYHKDTIAKICEVLDIEIQELLILEKDKPIK